MRGDRREEGGGSDPGILISWLEMPEPQQLLPKIAPLLQPGISGLENTGVQLLQTPRQCPRSPDPRPKFPAPGLGAGAQILSRSLLPPPAAGVFLASGWMEDLSLGGQGWPNLLSEARQGAQ